MKSDVWTEVVLPACQDRDAPVLFIGTPKGVDLFSDLFYKGLRLGGKWSAHRWTIYDVNIFSPEKVEEIRRTMSEKAFAREFMCDFEAGAEDQLISFADAPAASERVATDRLAFGAPVVLGVDPARFGDDRTVIVRRQGVVCFEPIVMLDADNMLVADVVAQQIQRHDPQAVFIDIGNGAGVVDRLRQLRHSVIEVPFGGGAHAKDLYLNRRAEMWVGMRDWLKAGGCIPDDLGLKQEMCAPTFTYDSKGRIKLESKDEIAKRIPEMSPDKADALALTFAAPVAPPTMESELRRRIPNIGGTTDEEPEVWDPWE